MDVSGWSGRTGNGTQKCDDEAVYRKGKGDGGTEETEQVRMGEENEWNTKQSGWNRYERNDLYLAGKAEKDGSSLLLLYR